MLRTFGLGRPNFWVSAPACSCGHRLVARSPWNEMSSFGEIVRAVERDSRRGAGAYPILIGHVSTQPLNRYERPPLFVRSTEPFHLHEV